MTIAKEKMQPRARITYDEMQAFLVLPIPSEDEVYTEEAIMECLEKNQIRHGIERETIRNMIQSEIYNREVCVATGTPMVDGIDGYFEYHFNRTFSNKPKVQPDGSVDYWSINMVEMVEKGQVIATYHPPVSGENGMSVKGKPLIAKRGREQSPLKGKGFTRQEDGVTYISNIDGKIDMADDRITILPVYEVFGNADLSVGNINFVGDVVIHGNVNSGVKIHATGSITIDGLVESADISADKDIVLRSGMVGGNRASLMSKQNIYAKFIEYTHIELMGSIEADCFVGCDIVCRDRIILNGKKGKIMGGEIYALKGVQVAVLGSQGEVKTEISVGVKEEIHRRIGLLVKKIQAMEENLHRIEEGLQNFDKLEQERGVSYRDDPRRAQLLRVKIQDIANIAKDRAELEDLRQQTVVEGKTNVIVEHMVYPGVSISIDDLKVQVREEQERVIFTKSGSKIIMERYEEHV